MKSNYLKIGERSTIVEIILVFIKYRNSYQEV